jgi:site-specific recombinase XerD
MVMNTTIITTLNIIEFLNTIRSHMKLCGYSFGTVKAYLGQIQGFIRSNRPINLRDITEQDIQIHLKKLVDSGLSRSTIDQSAKALEILYYELFKKQVNLAGCNRPRKERPAPTILTPNEVFQIAYHSKNSRNRLMIELAYSAGLRVSELIEVKVENLDIDRLRLHVSGLEKNNRITFFSKHLKESLIKQVGAKNTCQYLFPSDRGGTLTTRAVAKFFKKALIASSLKKSATPHSLRQSFINLMLDQRTSSDTLQNNLDLRALNSVPSPNSKKAA